MNIEYINPLIKGKEPWKRLVTPDFDAPPMTDSEHYRQPSLSPINGLHYQYLSNSDLLNESCEGAHLINSQYMSKRPIYEVETRTIQTPVKDAQGNPILNEDGSPKTEPKEIKEWIVCGFEDIETVRSGLPEFIIRTKVSHLANNGIQTANEGSPHDLYDNFRTWKDIAGFDAAWEEAIYACCKCGDAAIYPYVRGGTIEYSVFSALEGSTLFPQKDDKGRPMLVRLYQLEGQSAVDIHTTEEISTWVQADITEANTDKEEKLGIKTWWETVKGWFKNISIKKSEDGWTQINRVDSQIDEETLQIVYLRLADTPIGPAIQNINALERSDSYCSDKVKSMAYSKLFLKSSKIKNLPPLSSGEEVIGVENADADILRASSAEYLTPPDISNIATIDRKNKMEAIMLSTMTVDLDPSLLKSGSDSSNTFKLMLRREIQWCHTTWPQVRPAAKHLIDVLKRLVAKIEGDEEYTKLKVSVWNSPWIPQDEDAAANRVQQLYFSSIISAKAAREELGLQYCHDDEQIAKEQKDKIFRDTFTKLEAEAKAREEFGLDNTANDVVVDKTEKDTDNPGKKDATPKINNSAPRKKEATDKMSE